MDLGTPEKYLQAHFDLLAGQMRGVTYESPWIAATADIEPGAILGRRSSVGAEARVGPGATVEDSVIHPGASIGANATVRMTIVGPGGHVGENAQVTGSVLGAGARVADGLVVTDTKVPTDGEATSS
jgi:mannose-1-phosphate guanylyltransferase